MAAISQLLRPRRAREAGLLEDYTERRGGVGVSPSASTVAATLETMIQLQQKLLSMTAAQQQQTASAGLTGATTSTTATGGMPPSVGAYRSNEFSPSSGMDLQKSLQQLRQSQRYNVGSTTTYSGTASVGAQHMQQHVAPFGSGSTMAPLRDTGSSYQSSTLDVYSSKKGPPYGAAAPTGAPASSTFGAGSGAFGSSPSTMSSSSITGGSLSSALARTNEYRKSSLGPTAPIPTSYGRLPLGHLGRGGLKRY
ncbi:hypothetical protein HPB52_022957 [Rhipicephalus sanguineus]|uniref:Uncharacterized protein n=1 Tax=Rhipicephalus sanguineus TaxID=34632 RepID=A0A9D4SV89_RHISA|nr:hypothetical protein HPB52_022957 [Rhipicephalus sanguineus]